MRLEPAAPVAGQPVSFVIDISSVESCCATAITFGDSQEYTNIGSSTCAVSTNHTGLVVPHTYERTGVYKVQLVAVSLPCEPGIVDGRIVPAMIVGTSITACVAIGPGVVVAAGRC